MNQVFIILRHICDDTTNKYWRLCYLSIRKFYPMNDIIIIDNKSTYDTNHELILENCKIIESEIPHCRLYTPLYYYLQYYNKYDQAIIIHDGIIFNSFIDFSDISSVKFLWHFKNHNWDKIDVTKNIISDMDIETQNRIIKLYESKNWYGCFGCMLVINRTFIKILDEKYNLTSLKDKILNKESACEFERLLAVLCYLESDTISNDTSIMGDFTNLTWGLNLHQYYNNLNTYNQQKIVKLFYDR